MKALTDKQRQWLWFIALWTLGLAAFALLAVLVRMVAALLFRGD